MKKQHPTSETELKVITENTSNEKAKVTMFQEEFLEETTASNSNVYSFRFQ